MYKRAAGGGGDWGVSLKWQEAPTDASQPQAVPGPG